ncbi:glycosyltransferase [Butyrivibrio sp. CB08]|uniref:glycosyltransferase n=1 Tax=Butyrivibrio sp. CB08 TaxID=2364879 RepID=UPI000EA9A706|nr:glycosyltransferase [Butyrivibrio sp. CB08]RKM59807.1 glycosyltransferase [Butyrivibrio sp. CB08]
MDSSNKKNLMLMVPMLHQGGFERVCVKTARLLQDIYNVHILIFTSRDMHYDVSGIDVIDIDVPAKDGKLNKVINIFKRVNRVRKVKRDLGIDYSYSFGSSANYVNSLSGVGECLLTGLRGQIDLENPSQIKLFTQKSTRVLSCSKDIVRQLSENYGYDKSLCIYNPVDVEDLTARAAEPISDFPFKGQDVKVISCMGRDDYQKGTWHLVKAFYLAQKENDKLRLMILGDGTWENYRSLVDGLGIADKVAFMGAKKNPFPYLKASDLYVCPSNHEGFPNAVLEAMALGKPVISTDCKTGPREILLSDEAYQNLGDSIGLKTIDKPVCGDYGILVPNVDEVENFDPTYITPEEEMMGSQIGSLISDQELLSKYAERSFERAKDFSPEKYKENFIRILNSL